MTERYSMYDPALRGAVLNVLARWKQLPLSDLFQLLSQEDKLRYRDDVLDDLVWQGLIRSFFSGDEMVVAITQSGEQWVQSREQPAPRDVR